MNFIIKNILLEAVDLELTKEDFRKGNNFGAFINENPTQYAKGGSIKVGDKVKYPLAKMIGKVKSIKDLGWEKELTIEYDDGKIIKEGESSVIKLAKGGKTQGYNDNLDESLGNTKGSVLLKSKPQRPQK